MLLRAVLSHYRRHPLQLVALWLILTLATALWSGVWTLTAQARDSMAAGEGQLGGRHEVVRSDGAPVTVADFAALRRQGLCVYPWLQVTVDEGRGQRVGIDPLAMACASGDSAGPGYELDGEPFVDISEAAELAVAGQPHSLQFYAPSAEPALPPGWQWRGDPASLSTGELADSFLLNLDALGLLVVLVSALLIRSVYTLGLAQRRTGLTLLQRFGVARRRLRRYLLLELAVLAGLATLPGYLLGLWLANLLSTGFGAAMDSLFGTELLVTGESLTGLLVTLAMVALVVLWCGLDLLRLGTEHSRAPLHPAVGGVALLTGIGVVTAADTLPGVYMGTALMLVGAGLITPVLLVRFASARQHAPPLVLWRHRELGVLIRRLALPLVALQLAAATVIAVHALVSAFEATFDEWLDQRLAGDLYVEVPPGAPLSTAARVLDQQEGVAHWHPVLRGKARVSVGGATIAVDLMTTDTESPLIRQWSLLTAVADPWRAVSDGAVLVNEQLARRQGLGPGSEVSVVVAGQHRVVSVAGVYADYGRPAGEILLDMDGLPEAFAADFRSLTLALAANSSQTRQSMASALEQAWQVTSLPVRDNATIHRLANRIFEQTFALTRAISYLTLMLAGVALLMTGFVVLRSRAWYIGLLAAWGLTRRERRRAMVTLAAEFMAAIWLAAIPVGLVLTWVLVARINPVAFGWSLPMAVYPGYWLELLALFALAALLIGAVASHLRGTLTMQPPVLAGGQER